MVDYGPAKDGLWGKREHAAAGSRRPQGLPTQGSAASVMCLGWRYRGLGGGVEITGDGTSKGICSPGLFLLPFYFQVMRRAVFLCWVLPP